MTLIETADALTKADVLAALERAAPGGVLSRASDRLRMAHDASHYLLTPQAVVVPRDANQVGALLRAGAALGVPLTFRSGGTSLSGQSVTDQVLVDTRRHFRAVEVLDDGARVRVQPGATLRAANNRLAPHRTKLGPDPASDSACTVGGVVANNSSGMTCGTELNTYQTLDSLVLVLASGAVVDTGASDADERLRAVAPELFDGLVRLRRRVLDSPDSLRRIEAQYAMKNTMGYGLNSFVDHETPAQILAHLAVGSEGTLAFVAEATFRTVPVHPLAATGLLVFPTLREAMAAMPALVAAQPAAVELLDAQSLRVGQSDPKADAAMRALTVDAHAALLVEWQSSDPAELDARVHEAERVAAELPLSTPARLSGDPAGRAALWYTRKGLYAAVAGARPSRTTALLEDVAVPVGSLADTCSDLAMLFDRHGYSGSVIFGHAKDGNLHFMVNEHFATGASPDRYAVFTEEMVEVVLGYGGTLKAEHGTGRVMAPYVRRQFGDELYAVMREVKSLCDPAGILNPGVLVTDDAQLHLKHLKTVVTVEPEVDRCVECGFCEPVCPSADLTTTPRQRIALRREIAAADAAGNTALADELRGDYAYDAVQTCAADGMCFTACPVLINTGDLMKRLRTEANGPVTQAGGRLAARGWGATTRTMARGLDLAAVVPLVSEGATRAARAVLGADWVPRWQRDIPRGGVVRRPSPAPRAGAVYLPSCLNTLFAPAPGGLGVQAALQALAARAGVQLLVPDGIDGLCCGTPWSSKGLPSGHDAMRDRVSAALSQAGSNGHLPVITDAASCAEGFHGTAGAVAVIDAVSYVADSLLPLLSVTHRLGSVAVHPTCSSTRMGSTAALLSIASAIADEVVVPDDWGCCGFAGDRGMLHPELTASATAPEAAALRGRHFDAYASVNRTCEIGMTRATGRPYRHVLELLEEATR